jgi:tyrosine-protein phosphatase SIW14
VKSVALSFAVVSLIALVPVRYAYVSQARQRNLREVDPGLVYRSGKLTPAGLTRAVREYGLKTVVNFRAFESGPQPDEAEEELCRSLGLRYERIVYRTWASATGSPPADRSVSEFFALMDRRREIGPILVHCMAGKHRTGAFVALYRMEYQGWANHEALAEMRDIGYEDIDKEDDVRGYLERYVPRGKRK